MSSLNSKITDLNNVENENDFNHGEWFEGIADSVLLFNPIVVNKRAR